MRRRERTTKKTNLYWINNRKKKHFIMKLPMMLISPVCPSRAFSDMTKSKISRSLWALMILSKRCQWFCNRKWKNGRNKCRANHLPSNLILPRRFKTKSCWTSKTMVGASTLTSPRCKTILLQRKILCYITWNLTDWWTCLKSRKP